MLLYHSFLIFKPMKNHSKFNSLEYIGIACLILFLNSKTLNAQVNEDNSREKSNFGSRLFYGGGFGLQFGTVTLIELSPLIGYKVTPRFGIGVSPTYKYYSVKNYYSSSVSLKTNVYGGSIFARYFIFENVFAHAEYETLFYNTKSPGYLTQMQQFNSLLVGGGYRQQIGGNSAMNLMVLWNLNDTTDSPYTNPVIRLGFTIGM